MQVTAFYVVLFAICFCAFDRVEGLNYTLSLLYPLSYSKPFAFTHVFGAFILAMTDVNRLSVENGYGIQLNYTIGDTAANGSSYSDIAGASLRIVTDKVAEHYDGFVGPGIKETCSSDARLAAAFNKPMIGYVSSLRFP